jgi:hypothetical protein
MTTTEMGSVPSDAPERESVYIIELKPFRQTKKKPKSSFPSMQIVQARRAIRQGRRRRAGGAQTKPFAPRAPQTQTQDQIQTCKRLPSACPTSKT